eukprot:2017087-Pleurochrysis_carterae.AAC.2
MRTGPNCAKKDATSAATLARALPLAHSRRRAMAVARARHPWKGHCARGRAIAACSAADANRNAKLYAK